MRLTGKVRIEVVGEGGVRVAHAANHVVAVGRQIMAAQLIAPLQNPVVGIRFGTSDAATTDGMTGLVQPAGGLFQTTSEPDPTMHGVRHFRTYVPTSDLNGFTLREAGLVAANGNLFSRVTFPPIEKTSALRLVIQWTITLSND